LPETLPVCFPNVRKSLGRRSPPAAPSHDEFRRGSDGVKYKAMEPGLDLHEWQSRWESLEEDLEDSPRDVLPELDMLLTEMLAESGYAIDDPVASVGEGPEVVKEFASAREIIRLLTDNPESVSAGDVAAAVNGYRSVYVFLTEEFSAE
jgi:hypothetical protein